LGLGDILVPGLSVNYSIIFDRALRSSSPPQSKFKNVYFIVNLVGYLIGLFLAFVGLLFMNTAQPALLYLCPALIICSLATAVIRKEFKPLWTGEPVSY
jgi:minor histocompatibility antigen H13